MSLPTDLEEVPTEQLMNEFTRRLNAISRSRCPYCGQPLVIPAVDMPHVCSCKHGCDLEITYDVNRLKGLLAFTGLHMIGKDH